MAVRSYADQLEEVQAAIFEIESGGQAVSINGRAMNRAHLETLYQREKWLRQQVAKQDRGGRGRIYQMVPRG